MTRYTSMQVFDRKDLQVPVFENGVALGVARGIGRFLKAEAEPAPGASGHTTTQKLERAGRRIARKGRTVGMRLRRLVSGKAGGIWPENIVWIFGSGRTGSTWLSRMMGELEGHTVWREPLVGALFGNLYYERAKHLIGKTGKHYILGDGYRESWLGSIRAFVLKEASGRFPEAAGPNKYLVVKEPNGSAGAPLLMEALPESRIILLVRDPRDVTASSIDAKRKGSWQYENRNRGESDAETLVDRDPDAFVRSRAKNYVKGIGLAKEAYDAHEGRKVLVKYEELRADTVGTMRRIYSALEIPVDEKALVRAVEMHSWENIPKELKGEGKVYRKATPGGWREDLTPRQVRIVERITAPLLKEFYPA